MNRGVERGEPFMRELLAGRRFGWPVVHDVPMERRHIDHVAVGPRGVLAIETKSVRGCWAPVGDQPLSVMGLGWCPVKRPFGAVDPSCQGITDVPVQAVLTLWGPGRRTWSTGGRSSTM
jgi:hypothetical protein